MCKLQRLKRGKIFAGFSKIHLRPDWKSDGSIAIDWFDLNFSWMNGNIGHRGFYGPSNTADYHLNLVKNQLKVIRYQLFVIWN